MFMTDKEKEICKALDGVIAPCDAELNVDSSGYTLKTDTLEDLATAAVFFRDVVNDGKEDVPTCTIDVGIRTAKDVGNYAEMIVKRYSHFTDGGTPKKNVQEAVKIPEGKRMEFRAKLINAARKRCKLKYTMSCGWVSSDVTTTCYIEYCGERFIGTTKKISK